MNAKQKKAAVKKPAGNLEARRPAVNPPMPEQVIDELNGDFNNIKRKLENYAAHLRALDRKRLNGIGIKTHGFVERSYEYAAENPKFLPYYLTLEKFREDYAHYIGLRSLLDSCEQLQEILWNITIQAGNAVYNDSLEYYAMVREAAKRRVDPAETMYKDLEVFFKKRKRTAAAPTKKQAKRDANALLQGKKDGKIVIENVSPKVTAGVHKVIDETFNDTARFHETDGGQVRE